MWICFLFAIPFIYLFPSENWNLKNVYRTFFNFLLGQLNKMSKKSKIMDIYSLQMNKYLLYANGK